MNCTTLDYKLNITFMGFKAKHMVPAMGGGGNTLGQPLLSEPQQFQSTETCLHHADFTMSLDAKNYYFSCDRCSTVRIYSTFKNQNKEGYICNQIILQAVNSNFFSEDELLLLLLIQCGSTMGLLLFLSLLYKLCAALCSSLSHLSRSAKILINHLDFFPHSGIAKKKKLPSSWCTKIHSH